MAHRATSFRLPWRGRRRRRGPGRLSDPPGEPDLAAPMLAEVYTFPTGASQAGAIELTVEAHVSAAPAGVTSSPRPSRSRPARPRDRRPRAADARLRGRRRVAGAGPDAGGPRGRSPLTGLPPPAPRARGCAGMARLLLVLPAPGRPARRAGGDRHRPRPPPHGPGRRVSTGRSSRSTPRRPDLVDLSVATCEGAACPTRTIRRSGACRRRPPRHRRPSGPHRGLCRARGPRRPAGRCGGLLRYDLLDAGGPVLAVTLRRRDDRARRRRSRGGPGRRRASGSRPSPGGAPAPRRRAPVGEPRLRLLGRGALVAATGRGQRVRPVALPDLAMAFAGGDPVLGRARRRRRADPGSTWGRQARRRPTAWRAPCSHPGGLVPVERR